jgi:hypothetical protein
MGRIFVTGGVIMGYTLASAIYGYHNRAIIGSSL